MRFYIETDRLILRDIQDSDIDGMFELDSDPIVHKHLGNKPITTKEQAQSNIDYIRQQYDDYGIGRFAAVEKATGEFIGWTGIKYNTGDKEVIDRHRDFYDIGYRFMPRYWGKGYASESSFITLAYGFNELNIQTMCGAAEEANIASNKVLQKIGLKYIEDFVFWGEKIKWYELNKADYGA
ncbi:MAG: GNAT family N-acetyltransferase [bacterium]